MIPFGWRFLKRRSSALADADPAGLEAAKKKLKVADGFADYRAMLSICVRSSSPWGRDKSTNIAT